MRPRNVGDEHYYSSSRLALQFDSEAAVDRATIEAHHGRAAARAAVRERMLFLVEAAISGYMSRIKKGERAALMLRQVPHWSNRRIARAVEVSPPTVATVRRKLEHAGVIPPRAYIQGAVSAEALSKHTGQPLRVTLAHLRELERTGVVERAGSWWRLAPKTLHPHKLGNPCISPSQDSVPPADAVEWIESGFAGSGAAHPFTGATHSDWEEAA